MTITPMPNGRVTVNDPASDFSSVMTREDAYCILARTHPERTAEQERMGLMPLGAYIAGFCKFIDGEPYIYDAGYKPLDNVLRESDGSVREYILKMIALQEKTSITNAVELESVTGKIRQASV